MKREIKFRAWDGYTMELPFTSRVYKNIVFYTFKFPPPASEADLVILQYTGLKDKNGKDIYEDDIVERFGGKYSNGIVEWDNYGLWRIICPEEEWSYGTDQREFSETHEVIGNIYENPELLK